MSPVNWNAAAIAGIVLQHSGVVSLSPSVARGQFAAAPVYTLDNGHSLQYAELLRALTALGRPVAISETYQSWLTRLVATLEGEDKTAPMYSNPLRALRGALTAKPPKFGSTGCLKHMELLEQLGFPCPAIDEKYLSVYLQRFINMGALPSQA